MVEDDGPVWHDGLAWLDSDRHTLRRYLCPGCGCVQMVCVDCEREREALCRECGRPIYARA